MLPSFVRFNDAFLLIMLPDAQPPQTLLRPDNYSQADRSGQEGAGIPALGTEFTLLSIP